MFTQEDIKNALKAVKYPGYSRDIVSFGLIKEISVPQGGINVVMQLTTSNPEAARQIKEDSERVLKALPGVSRVQVEVIPQGAPPAAGAQSPWAQQQKVPGIRRIVAVASGKGGSRICDGMASRSGNTLACVAMVTTGMSAVEVFNVICAV